MGQGASQPQRGDRQASAPAVDDSTIQRRRQSSLANLLRSQEPQSAANEDGGNLSSAPTRRRLPIRSNSTNRLSRFLPSTSTSTLPTDAGSSRPSALQRSRTTLSNIFRRDDAALDATRPSHSRGILHNRVSSARNSLVHEDDGDYRQPGSSSLDRRRSRLEQDILNSDREHEHEQPPRSSGSNRLPNLRFNALRPDGPFRHITSGFPQHCVPLAQKIKRPC
jgi:hypothetical protein